MLDEASIGKVASCFVMSIGWSALVLVVAIAIVEISKRVKMSTSVVVVEVFILKYNLINYDIF